MTMKIKGLRWWMIGLLTPGTLMNGTAPVTTDGTHTRPALAASAEDSGTSDAPKSTEPARMRLMPSPEPTAS